VAQEALIEVLVAGPPQGGRPRLAVGPNAPFDTAPEERERVNREATRAVVLVDDAPLHQLRLLERLAGLSPEGGLRFPFVATLEHFLAATTALDDDAAAALPDGELLERWRDAERRTGGHPSPAG
jgi:hypothetical protein